MGIILRKIMGRFLCQQLARILTLSAYVILVKRRRILKENFRHIATEDKRLAREVFINYGLSYADFLAIPSMSKEQILEIAEDCGFFNLGKALSLGKGAIMVSAHIGNWDLGGCFTTGLGYKTAAITESRGPGERIFKLYSNLRAKTGMRIIRLEDKGSVTSALDVLRRNGVLIILGDRDITKDGIKVNYLGTESPLPRGPAFFSLRTGAPILPSFFVWHKGKYLAIMEPMIEFTRSGDLKKDIKDLTQLVAKRLEKRVYEYPTQWYVFDMNWEN
jgi:KDO2-lipid IV(A) lauroyltransferase